MNNSVKLAIFLRIFEALPLIVFLSYFNLSQPEGMSDWLGPYLASSIVAVCTTSVLSYRKQSLNCIFLGINLYLFSGYIGLISNQVWLNKLYGVLEASGMLAWVAATCLAGFIIKPAWVFGSIPKAKWLPVYFILLVLLSAIFSYFFVGQKLLSEVLPFVFIFVIHGYFKKAA